MKIGLRFSTVVLALVFLAMPSATAFAEGVVLEAVAEAESDPVAYALSVCVDAGATQGLEDYISAGCLAAIVATVGVCIGSAGFLCGLSIYASLGVCTCFNSVGFADYVLGVALATGSFMACLVLEGPTGDSDNCDHLEPDPTIDVSDVIDAECLE